MYSVLVWISGLLFTALIAFGKATLKFLAFLLVLFFAASAAWLAYGYATCNPITSDEQAFAIAKKFVLEDGMKELHAAGGDASIFEGTVLETIKTSFYNCDFAPARYTTFRDYNFASHHHLKYRIVQFWDCTKDVSARVAVDKRCGNVSILRDSFDYFVFPLDRRLMRLLPMP